jgi:hypothetical protein
MGDEGEEEHAATGLAIGGVKRSIGERAVENDGN